MFSTQHAALIDATRAATVPTWSDRALLGCLEKLRDGGPTEWQLVTVHDAWPLQEVDGFCVVYTSPWGPQVGVRVTRDTPSGAPFYPSGLYAQPLSGGDPTAEEFGQEIADLGIAEPLGSRGSRLVMDGTGLGWWGDAPLPGTHD
ncbi:hypothetical protein [Curtobacterium sp. Leaf261]|uniref:hypothetical protein n=1 Tax=Curtobacterium sp. Leaf261 TaxID=1736311 RepID=UPI0009E9AF94|nr:hypothetical protein [Curtobacterium sp. Leaf261]